MTKSMDDNSGEKNDVLGGAGGSQGDSVTIVTLIFLNAVKYGELN